MLVFKKINGTAVAVAPTGLNVIAFGNGFQCGTHDDKPVAIDDSVAVYTSLIDCDINGNPTDSVRLAPDLTVFIPVTKLSEISVFKVVDGKIAWSDAMFDLYTNELIALSTPEDTANHEDSAGSVTTDVEASNSVEEALLAEL